MATRAMSTEVASKTSDTPNMENYNFETLKVTRPKDFVLHVELNRPEKRNAMNTAFWRWEANSAYVYLMCFIDKCAITRINSD